MPDEDIDPQVVLTDEQFDHIRDLYSEAIKEADRNDANPEVDEEYEAANAYWSACQPHLTEEDESLIAAIEIGRYAGGGKGDTRDMLEIFNFLMIQKHNRGKIEW